jgi:type IV pilus assembly protein PilP
MKRRLVLAVCGCIALAACGGESHQDLRAWMATQGEGVKGKLEPLPQMKPYEPFTYNAFDLPDPFKPRKIEPGRSGSSKLAPDLARRKEPLEAFPLESLNMVGSMQQGKATYGLVRTPERDVFQVRVGNYMGQDYGVVTAITDAEIRLKELVQDSAGDWTERSSTLQLIQADSKTQERRK